MTERDPHPSEAPTERFGDDDLATGSATEPAEPAATEAAPAGTRAAPVDEAAPVDGAERAARRGRITVAAGAAVVLLAALGGSFALGRATAGESDGPGDLRSATHHEEDGHGGWFGDPPGVDHPRDHRGDRGDHRRGMPFPGDRWHEDGGRASGPEVGPPTRLPDHPGWDCDGEPDDTDRSDADPSEEADRPDGA